MSTENSPAVRPAGWYWVRKEGFRGEHGPWTPALWRPEFRSWYSVEFSGIPDFHVIVGAPLAAPQPAGDALEVVGHEEIATLLVRQVCEMAPAPTDDPVAAANGVIAKARAGRARE